MYLGWSFWWLFVAAFVCSTSRGVVLQQNDDNDQAGSCAGVPFGIRFNDPRQEWNHFFTKCVGSGHASLALRSDWREQLSRARLDLGVEYVRFHGILDDDMSTYLGGGGENEYSFFNMDSIYDFLVKIGMKPVVELSFMPELLASNASETVFHYKGGTSPPKSYSQFATFMKAVASHLVDRYGIEEVSKWYFEVWNEPNCGFWKGTQAEYFVLFEYVSNAVTSVDKRLRVGGPVTCQSQWIPEFMQYVRENKLPASFVSTHEYPTDIKPLQRGIMRKRINETLYQADPLPVLYTETNDGLYFPGKHDDPYAAAWAFFNIQDIMPLATRKGNPPGLELLSWWTFTDIFEEQGFYSSPFHQGFGMISIYNIAKPVYKGYELLARSGSTRYGVSGSHPTAGVFVTDSGRSSSETLVYVYNHNIPQSAIKKQTLCIKLEGVDPSKLATVAKLERIDSTHSNAPAAWRAMGSPQYILPYQTEQLRHAAAFQREEVLLTPAADGNLSFTVTLEPEAVALVTVYHL